MEELKKHMQIGTARKQYIKVYVYSTEELLYEGEVDDAPREIREKFYVKALLGNPTVYYVEE